MITKDEIRNWIESGKQKGAKYVLIYCDTYDWSDYPVYAEDDKEFWEKYDNPLHQMSNMQKLMEVYDLSLNLEAQLSEYRAMHIPNRTNKNEPE